VVKRDLEPNIARQKRLHSSVHTSEQYGEDSLIREVLVLLGHEHNFAGVPTLTHAAWGADRRT